MNNRINNRNTVNPFKIMQQKRKNKVLLGCETSNLQMLGQIDLTNIMRIQQTQDYTLLDKSDCNSTKKYGAKKSRQNSIIFDEDTKRTQDEIIQQNKKKLGLNTFSQHNSPKNSSFKHKFKRIFDTDFQISLQQQELAAKVGIAKTSFFDDLKVRNLHEAIQHLKIPLQITIDLKDINMFVQSLNIIAEYYYQASDFSNSIYIYNMLRTLGQVSGNYDMKIQALIKIGDIFKTKNQYNIAMKIYKNALHYSWYSNNKEKEIILYDKIGKNYFELGKMEQASYFHDRSVNGLVESKTSQVLKHSLSFIKTIISEQKTSIYDGINPWLLTKLGIVQDDELKIETYFTFNTYAKMFSEEVEFRDNFPDPKYPADESFVNNGYVNIQGFNNNKKEEIGKIPLNVKKILDNIEKTQQKEFPLNQMMAKNGSNYFNSIKDNYNPNKLQENILKFPLHDQIERRLSQINFQNNLEKQNLISGLKSSVRRSDNVKSKQMLSHNTPNRSVAGFNYFLKQDTRKITTYFNRMSYLVLGKDPKEQRRKSIFPNLKKRIDPSPMNRDNY